MNDPAELAEVQRLTMKLIDASEGEPWSRVMLASMRLAFGALRRGGFSHKGIRETVANTFRDWKNDDDRGTH